MRRRLPVRVACNYVEGPCPLLSLSFLHYFVQRRGVWELRFGHLGGLYAEYAVASARAAVKVPEGLGVDEAAVSADAVLTAYHAVKYTGDVRPGQRITIFGLGGLGLRALQTTIHLGASKEEILVADKRQESLHEAVKLGILKKYTFLIGHETEPLIEKYVAEQGVQVDTVFDFAGHVQTVQAAQMVVRNGGTVVLVDLISPTVPLTSMVTVLKAATIKTAYNGTINAFNECLELMAKRVLKPVVETFSIKVLPSVLRDLNEE